jgi:glycosyltransferase involved in cell wall biosynthesis
MQPKITIIIPVYNVEKYLRQCLDSVVGQTLQELQIICVDHSSTDGSCTILEEFAAKDLRIKVIHCENTGGGPGQARNAGLPHVKGKYLYFVDSDDWLDPTLCEKAYFRLEQSDGDVVLFYAHEIVEVDQNWKTQQYDMDWWPIQSDASNYFGFTTSPWNRVVRTSYLENTHFRFPEGMLSEDVYYHWISLANQPRVFFLPQKLYYYRQRTGSVVGLRGEYMANTALVYPLVKQYLLEIGKYKEYREAFLVHKLSHSAGSYGFVVPSYRDMAKQNILESLDDDEIAFIKEERIPLSWANDFYYDLLELREECPISPQQSERPIFRQKLKKIKRKITRPLKNLLKTVNRVVFRPLENFVRFVQGKPMKTSRPAITVTVKSDNSSDNSVETAVNNYPIESPADRQIRELSELVCQLSKEVVELRAINIDQPCLT